MGQKVKVLIVEDEAWEIRYLQIVLQDLNYEFCTPVSTGREAIEYAAQENPDIILMDIRLAGAMDGIEAAEVICSQQAIPIIFMTGYALQEIKDRAAQLNPVAFLEKPVSQEDIASVVKTLGHT